MFRTKILDCTLRDGGYINQWLFGRNCISRMIGKLGEAGIDIIECGFLRDVPYNEDASVFNDIAQIAPLIVPKQAGTMYVAMIAIGEIASDKIAPKRADSIDGIRLTFHKHEIDQAFSVAKQLDEKGYHVFLQPVGTAAYSDMELLALVERINMAKPYAFYMVDTLGSMYKNDVIHMFHLVNKNMLPDIALGFHSHNNLQLAFSNAQALVDLNSQRTIILDTSIYGMGRGAGNLCTELMTQYINDNCDGTYAIIPQLEIIDDHLNKIYGFTAWGYTVPFCLAAMKKCHPNYVEYLIGKQTLSIKPIERLLNRIPAGEGMLFNKNLIEKIYSEYQNNQVDDRMQIEKLRKHLSGCSILVVGPGSSITENYDKILYYIEHESPVIISVNFVPKTISQTYVFFGNTKRFEAIGREGKLDGTKVIATSNLVGLSRFEDKAEIDVINYIEYAVSGAEGDNAGLMLVRLLIHLGVKRIALAGLDGFVAETRGNYYNSDIAIYEKQRIYDEKNANIKKQFDEIRQYFPLQFITPSKYE